MILPRFPDPSPRDLGRTVLLPGQYWYDTTQPLAACASTYTLLQAVLAATDVGYSVAWWRFQVARQGRN